jgi:hypothetical protein
MRMSAALAVLCLVVALAHSQEASKAQAHEPTPHRQAGGSVSAEDAQALRTDLQRMKALVQQMQTNLAFVTNTQGPLKHQFELEIEMWQLQITSMERRLNNPAENKMNQ